MQELSELNERELAIWLACALDTEGSILLYQTTTITPRIVIYNNNLDFMNFANQAIEKLTRKTCKIKMYKWSQAPEHWKPEYKIELSDWDSILDFLSQTVPFLVAKKTKANILLQLASVHKKGTWTKQDFLLAKQFKEVVSFDA
jgi:hypothetical protein